MKRYSKSLENDKNIIIIKQTILEYGAEKIILFGSRAKHLEQKFSDYDILAIFQGEINRKDKYLLASKIRKELAKHYIDADIIIKTKKEFEKSKFEIGNIIKSATLEGIYL